MTNIDTIKSLIEKEEFSPWRRDALWRRANRTWLTKSTKIALLILNQLSEKGITQLEFAKLLDTTPQYVSNIVKGRENLTLELICRIEEVLEIKILN